MKPLLSITLLTWMCLFGVAQTATAQVKQTPAAAAVKEKFTWHTDFTKASALAQQTNRKLFILFTGSDWCPPCQALKKNVLSNAGFQSAAMKEYVFVMCDFPNRKKLSSAQKAHNKKMASKYNVEAYPTVILTNAKGKRLKTINAYQGESAAQYLRKL